ncbi:ATP-binding protein [Streptomyces smaragdinus]|uniref:ATP-binding protein n=1 Tax=Streptomyces smaragdinus TaxID=2585196 RepID=UPI002B20159B|nr:ATP-binding protein [Streptomyces smaragdinus]
MRAALVPPDGPVEWSFPADPGAVRTARAVVRETLRSWQLDLLTDLTVLLVSELVTNSLRYADGPIGVRLTCLAAGPLPAALRVEVSDPLPDLPCLRVAGPGDEGGRGLQLVAGTARSWGSRSGVVGKTVWFELPLAG